ncbi:malto-oligosyltrehalose synthase [Sphaerisporangium krabiense]|uniref:(1->4)-alpha-D-glucan 1-alpha-D-glucosylmutase n=1 Tax=Sphaerisporangium krabiense TaxID=763782 RepID=A0A7W8YZ23_9ACTN|nr:malto-oligosyltrehalose synthase [Sphaerisporangium krabiense]MBB5624468.1 (1->4)-alpha-D-glucan 1-alpha-D-glucosylmutase [Sphaerisporangium krabiense]GII61576.1 malto-oligosyltrehalose synthase [Sphaerisporangium krabiense]
MTDPVKPQAPPRPTATYRLQLTPDFGFAEAAELTSYLAELGVSHLYLSPILQASPESRHGYDVTDHSRVREEFGGMAGLRRLAARGLPIVVDIVPNHMTVPVPESRNARLWDVLRHGPGAASARWFDLDWIGGQVALPVLGPGADPEAEVVADGDVLRYHDHEYPLRGDGRPAGQFYRLVPWRDAPGYRRFFDVSSLIGLRAEDPEVFEATHEVILRLVAEGLVTGLRVDHPDGLADPRGYLARLRERAPVWTVAEKILVEDERLPGDWACEGTTGYDALNMVTRLFVDPGGEEPLLDVFVRHTGFPPDYDAVRYEAKKQVLEEFFTGEVDRLTREVPELREAFVELLADMPVYRAYAVPGEEHPEETLRIVRAAAEAASARTNPEAVAKAADLALYGPPETVVRFQQTCGPVMAKGVEDTALYRWYPLACLNEVGGEPDHFWVSPDRFHRYCQGMAPHTMTTLSTHDTKRSEDVRARLAVLSELPAEWAEAVAEWSAQVSFDPKLDYLAWQNLMAAWPIGADRFADFLAKAAREAKTSMSWADPDPSYEEGVRAFAARAIEVCGPSVAAFTERVDRYARANSLGQKLVQLMMPGVPDVYQGCETTDFSLVDPDNRRPVDFAYRRSLLRAPGGDSWDAAKLLVTASALRLRARVGADLPYVPLETEGIGRDHSVAFARGERAVVVVTRLPAGLERRGGWGCAPIGLPQGRWRDVLTGVPHTGRVPYAHLLARYPVALLERG